jgi:hypothetical protein
MTFKADPTTIENVRRLKAALVADLGGLVNGGKSQVIRKAIADAAAKLDEGE